MDQLPTRSERGKKMELWEVSLRTRVQYEELRREVVRHFSVDSGLVVSSEEFIDALMRGDGTLIGISVSHSMDGFGTLCDISLARDRGDLDLARFASHAAIAFGTEVAIGDCTGQEEEFSSGRYLAFFPDGSWRHAGEVANGDVFELGFYSEPHAFDELVELLESD